MYPVQTKMIKNLVPLSFMVAISACTTVQGITSEASSEAAPIAAAPVFVLDDIANKSDNEIEAILGAADLTRVEGEGVFHRYDLAACGVVIVFLSLIHI